MNEEASYTTCTTHLIRSSVRVFLFPSVSLLTFCSVRSDITMKYFNGDFILLPTHKTYMDAMAFSDRAGCFSRDEEDDSPRRPLTAVRTPLTSIPTQCLLSSSSAPPFATCSFRSVPLHRTCPGDPLCKVRPTKTGHQGFGDFLISPFSNDQVRPSLIALAMRCHGAAMDSS